MSKFSPPDRAQFEAQARKTAFRLAAKLGTDFGLSIGDERMDKHLAEFLDDFERVAGELFDHALALKDLPEGHNIIHLRIKR